LAGMYTLRRSLRSSELLEALSSSGRVRNGDNNSVDGPEGVGELESVQGLQYNG
jgi:hypothetical protein